MNLLGIHAFVWVSEWSEEALGVAIKRSADVGYDLIEVPIRNAAEFDLNRIGRVIESAGLAVRCSMALRRGYDIGGESEEEREAGKALLINMVEACDRIGSHYLGGVLHEPLGHPREGRSEEVMRRVGEAIEEVAVIAGRYGIELGLEITNRYETGRLNTIADGMRFIEGLGADNVSLLLDTFHMHLEERDIVEAVTSAEGAIGYVQVGESHRGELGAGLFDFGEFFRALRFVGYGGPITFEAFTGQRAVGDLGKTLCLWREIWDDPEEVAANSLAYLKSAMLACRELYA